MTTTTTRFIPVAETAKLIRADLKEFFPGIKFSVRSKSYGGGGHVSVSWTDGPTGADVQRVCSAFESASFDGRQDLESSHTGMLNGEKVHFGNDWTHCIRIISVEFLTAVARAYCQRYNHPMPVIGVSGNSAYILDQDYSDLHDYRMDIQRKVEATDAGRLDTLFEEEDRQIAEYEAEREKSAQPAQEASERVEWISTPKTPKPFIIREEAHPLQGSLLGAGVQEGASIFRVYREDDTPLYIGRETVEDAEAALRQ